MFESWFQAILQIIWMLDYEISVFINWEDEENWDKAFPIFGLLISCLSILYGLSAFNLRKILRSEPSIMKTLWFALTELSTSIMIFLYLPAVTNCFWSLWYLDASFKTILVITLFTAIPIFGAYQLSFRMLRLDKGYYSADYRINLSLKCHGIYSLEEMVMARRRLVIINMIYVLVTTCALTIGLYCINKNDDLMSYVVILAWYTACILSFLQNAIELLFILIAKKSFLDWAFKAGLKEEARLAKLREQKQCDELEENNLLALKMSEL